MLKYPYTIGRVYEKVGKTSSGEIGKAYKGALAIPTIAEQYAKLNSMRGRAVSAEDELTKIKSEMIAEPNLDEIITSLMSGSAKTTLTKTDKSKIVELTSLSSDGLSLSEEENLIDLQSEVHSISKKAARFSTEIMLASVSSDVKKLQDAEGKVVQSILNHLNTGSKIQPSSIKIISENISPSRTIKEVEVRGDFTSPFMEHYRDITEKTSTLDALYHKVEHYGMVKNIQSSSLVATHYKKGNKIKKI